MGRRHRRTTTTCNAIEVMLRSGRGSTAVADPDVHLEPAPRRQAPEGDYFSERVEVGMLQVGRRLQTVLTVLSPYRDGEGELRTAYVEAHDALGDLAATYTWVTLGGKQARRARPEPRRRPWGG